MNTLTSAKVARVLVVGGSPERSSVQTIRFAQSGCDRIVAVDRGLDAVLEAGLLCDLFCGDADTVGERGLSLVEQAQSCLEGAAFEVERYDPNKDAPDLALALRAIEKRWPDARLFAPVYPEVLPTMRSVCWDASREHMVSHASWRMRLRREFFMRVNLGRSAAPLDIASLVFP